MRNIPSDTTSLSRVILRWSPYAYVDDVLIYTDGDLDEHEYHVRLVLAKLQKAGLGLDIDKCEFNVKTTKFLGFIISTEGEIPSVRIDPEKVRVISEWEAPKPQKDCEGFWDFQNFIGGTPWRWGAEQQEAFEILKAKFIAEPSLAQWDPDNETMLEADSSGNAIGGCLLQRQKEGIWKPVAYYSRT
ncbi:hypothetical protein K3495_g3936 [Podosphaera aphanis]|nr:hypothetical protein K3495_g3936 [Podosphaera aphanis]